MDELRDLYFMEIVPACMLVPRHMRSGAPDSCAKFRVARSMAKYISLSQTPVCGAF